jgi:hypothetical protein
VEVRNQMIVEIQYIVCKVGQVRGTAPSNWFRFRRTRYPDSTGPVDLSAQESRWNGSRQQVRKELELFNNLQSNRSNARKSPLRSPRHLLIRSDRSLLNSFKSGGSSPSKSLPDRSAWSRWVSTPSSFGICPYNSFSFSWSLKKSKTRTSLAVRRVHIKESESVVMLYVPSETGHPLDSWRQGTSQEASI